LDFDIAEYSLRATNSANGATARAQVGAVSDISLYSVSCDVGFRQRLFEFVKSYNAEQKGQGRRAFVVRALWECRNLTPLLMSALAQWTALNAEKHGESALSSKAVAATLRSLDFKVAHGRNGYFLIQDERCNQLLQELQKEYGLTDEGVHVNKAVA
jgi:hypothetical protein